MALMTTHRARRLGPLQLAVVCMLSVLATSTGCSPLIEDPDDYEPLEIRADGGVTTTCPTDRGSRDFTDGSNVIRYSGEEVLTITNVDLVDGHGFGVAEVVLVPVRPVLVGSWFRWPPPKPRSVLRGAIPAVGAKMGRDRVEEYNLVAHLTRPDLKTRAAGAAVRLFYAVGEKEYGSVAPVRLGVSIDGESCYAGTHAHAAICSVAKVRLTAALPAKQDR